MASRPSRRWLRPLIGVLLTVAWIVVAGLGGHYFGRINEVATNDQSLYLPSSAESTQVHSPLARSDRPHERDLLLAARKDASAVYRPTLANTKRAMSRTTSAAT
jgi:hypothetical protein